MDFKFSVDKLIHTMSKNYQKCGKYRGTYQKSQKNKENRENQAIFKNTGKA